MNIFNQFGGVNKPGHCCWCGRKLRKYKYPDHFPNNPDPRGDYADGFFCGLRCGYKFGVRLAQIGSRLQPVAVRHVDEKKVKSPA